MTEHRYLGVESTPRRLVAVCSCGWRSEPFSSAGLAGSAWDRHRDEERAKALAEGGRREARQGYGPRP